MAQMIIGIDTEPIKNTITETLSDFRVQLEETNESNQAMIKEFKQIKEMTLDMYNVLSYIAEHWER